MLYTFLSIIFLVVLFVCFLLNKQIPLSLAQISKSFRNKFSILFFTVLFGLSFLFYFQLGSPNFLDIEKTEEQKLYLNYSKALGSLENQINQNPEDAFSWFLLSEGYFKLEQNNLAEKYIAHAYEIDLKDEKVDYGEILLLYAKVLALKQGDFKSDLALNYLKNAHKKLLKDFKNPQNLNAVQKNRIQLQLTEAAWLLGFAYFNNNEINSAIEVWSDTEGLDLSESQRQVIDEAIIQAKVYQDNQFEIKLSLTIEKELLPQIQTNASVFVVLREFDENLNGTHTQTRMPLAAKKIENLNFPKEIVLNQNDLLSPSKNKKINKEQNFSIQVFISQQAIAEMKSGDFFSAIKIINQLKNHQKIDLKINQTL